MQEVSRTELVQLKWKYEEMRRLRLEDLAHPGGDPRRDMAVLAERFPGSLREIEELTLDAIDSRIAELSRYLMGEEIDAPWVAASARFHRLLRGALAAKKWLGARRRVDSDLVSAFRASLQGGAKAEDAHAWVDDLDKVARPPGGRLSALVFDRLASELEISAGEARTRVLGPPLLRGAGRGSGRL